MPSSSSSTTTTLKEGEATSTVTVVANREEQKTTPSSDSAILPPPVIKRFPPEQNGYLHLGHAKAVSFDFTVARMYGGVRNMRLDDTNPLKEDVEYVQTILEDVKWVQSGVVDSSSSSSSSSPDNVPWSGPVRQTPPHMLGLVFYLFALSGPSLFGHIIRARAKIIITFRASVMLIFIADHPRHDLLDDALDGSMSSHAVAVAFASNPVREYC